jgi:histidyl-tRNA synthetase
VVKFKSIKGTRDILPEDSHRWQFVEQQIRSRMHIFNYKEIRTPVFEETALFARGIGELTDIVSKEMYTFLDRSETSLTLKPEMTASVIRAYLQHNLGDRQPLTKVYYISPMFRQERPQAGRLRQFHQFGAEAIGGSSAGVDADVIILAMEVYRTLGVRSTTLKINSVGCQHCRPAYKQRLQDFLQKSHRDLSDESRRRIEQNPLRILDSKDEGDQQITANAPLMKDYLCPECAVHFEELQSSLSLGGVPFIVDGRIVRGLDYYTKTAFEITSKNLGSQDALAGGGRYDLLAEELGGKATPSVGFAAGIERLLMVLEQQHVEFSTPSRPFLFIASADDEGKTWAVKTVIDLRRVDIPAELDHLARSLKAQMREADRQQANFSLVIGANEILQNSCQLKNMTSGEQVTVSLSSFIDDVKKLRSLNAQ